MGYELKPEEHVYKCDCCEKVFRNSRKLDAGRPLAWHRVTLEWTKFDGGLTGKAPQKKQLIFCAECSEGLVESLKAAMVTKKITEAA